ncbi:hypothetical protein AAER22_00220 [Pseudomonas aeruginosa]|uniref:hypothetical protein n=1 Tax=Pseudomonas aeruginosa TaxID=287 RepID=UPI00053E2C02|nr:hypothetical protein [Pseudomonas aeruginosa]MBN0513591.1 hypothetical protein [Pseudomonas aeruginosa]MBO8385415.1 hypothetical protein [Pseudomonas aeruginosa]MCO2502972.1 hypothetical protein [Pseudomonas aeruginosa]MDY1024519.1 hypothetical protein [Pseudomonas aeruginosa]NRS64574.1 hypothetical protein [Pseudomonas aeruginosa]
MATVTHVLSGAGAPPSAPPSVGAHYVNTTNGDQYLAKGTASAADWVKQGGGGGSAPSEVLHITGAGNFSLGPQHAVVEAPLNNIPENEIGAVDIETASSRQFDLHVKGNADSVFFVGTAGGVDLPGGTFIVGMQRNWASTREYGFQIRGIDLAGEVWARVYYDAIAGTMTMLVLADMPAPA